jgi:hypothetical protein
VWIRAGLWGPQYASGMLGDALPGTRGAAVALALASFDELVAAGETVEDEWTYVSDMAATGRAAIAAMANDPEAVLPPGRASAVVAAAAEVARIADPHRAIDWLSTFPAVIGLALGPAPTTSTELPASATPATPAGS